MRTLRQILRLPVAVTALSSGLAVSVSGGTFNTDFNGSLPAIAHLYGGMRPDGVTEYPALDGGALKLTYAFERSQTGSLVLDDLDAGQKVSGFTAKFKLLIGGGTGADGFSFNFAPDLPDGPFGQEGTGTGLTVSFDTYDNGGSEAPAIDIKMGGVVVLHKYVGFAFLRANKFLDVVIQATSDGSMNVSYGTNVVYTNVFAFVPMSGRFGLGAANGGAPDSHWVDDLDIVTTPLAGPYVQSAQPTGPDASATPTIQVALADSTTQVNATSVKLKFDGADVQASASKNGGVTTIAYSPPDILASGSSHTFSLTYNDSGNTERQAQFNFTVANYTPVPSAAALTANDVDTAKTGFRVRPVQARAGANLLNNLARADAQLAGTLIDPTTQQPFENKAVPGPNADGSYDETGMIDYDFNNNPFPGIPGTEGNTDFCAADVTTYLQLDRGYHIFGVTSDDGFRVTTGADPRDAFAAVLGAWDGTRSAAETRFSFVAEKAGIYPFRLVWENGTGSGALKFFSVNPADGSQVNVNGTDPTAVKAYRALKVAAALPAYVLTVSPQPGEINVDRRPTVSLVLLDDGTQVAQDSVKLSFDDNLVNATVAKNGTQTTVTYRSSANLDNLSTHKLSVVFSDNATPANTRAQDWYFTTARSIQVTGQWDFDQGDLSATIGQEMQYGDGPTGRVKAQTSFGTTASFGIPDIGGRPAKVMKYTRDEFADVADHNPRGYLCAHGMAPNGGGTKVNQFTMIIDMMIPDLHQGDNYNTVVKWEAVDDFNIDGSISIKANDIGGDNTGGIGISGQYTGDGVTWIQGGKWQRVIVAVDMAAPVPIITYYIDGVRFGEMTTGDRWGLDQRHAIPSLVRLYGDGENDNEVNTLYVNSVQFRDGTMTAAEAAALGAAAASGIPYPGYVGGQWDFDQGDLRATVGTDMEYGDGPTGRMNTQTSFGTTTSFGIPDIGGKPATVMKYTRDEFADVADHNPRGYLVSHGLIPNAGGTKVNQFAMIIDMMIPDLHQGDNYNTVVKWEAVDDFNIDGSISIKANDIGGDNTGGIGISGQYTGDGVTWIQGGKWQRLIVAVDMAAAVPVITYYLDGVRFGEMTTGDRWGFDLRHAIPPVVRLYGDGENDNEVNTLYVNSVQFRDGTFTAAQAVALGTASADGIPLVIPGGVTPASPRLKASLSGHSLTISWDATVTGFNLEGTPSLVNPQWSAVPGVANNSVAIDVTTGTRFYRLKN